MSIADEFRQRNFSIYGQWSSLLRKWDAIHAHPTICPTNPRTILSASSLLGSQFADNVNVNRLGVLSIILGFALGIANLFHASLLILFSIILLVSSFVLIFVEIPLLLRICPTSSKFDAFIRRFTTNYMRAAIYGTLSLVQWLSIIIDASSLIAAAVVLAFAGACYALAGFKQQDFVGSKTLGGQGVAQMIV
ncbi:Golgi apparatus membrane protein tvp18 [Exophiala bonariae]|uniref:Golgi apparatus membrane protein tvp18 n=1 Tax=Exophiala bonariae TaxID=1690606 RepID=A0AAV9NK11_9EURO|nr:Golgi apparatus membrane protein tvp18 [Exophiala bonariae]